MMAEAGDKKSIMLQKLLSEPSRFLATIQIGITLAGFLASAFASESFADQLSEFLFNMGLPISRDLLNTVSLIVITLVLSYFTLVFGELVPKRLAMNKAEQISGIAVTPLTILAKATSPFVKLLTLSMNITVRMFGVDPNAEDDDVTEEEIRMMVDVGEEKGAIQQNEKVMINNIFELDNKDVSDIMTHRTNIVAIPIDYTLKKTVQIVNEEKYTRYPVYKEDMDHIVGILHSKDLIQFLESSPPESFDLKKLVRDPIFVLESKKIDDLFKEMQKYNVHMAIAIDEYGGTDGIVTIEDVIEEIVGNIFDEYDELEMNEEEIIKINESQYLMAGTTNLYEVEEILNINFPNNEFDTLSGFLIGQLGFIPVAEEHPSVEYENISFIVEKSNDRRIEQVKVVIQAERQNEDAKS